MTQNDTKQERRVIRFQFTFLSTPHYSDQVRTVVPPLTAGGSYEGWALVAGWFAASAMCVVNYSSCGRYHCKITGLGFFGPGILAVLDTVGVANPAAWIIWTALSAVLAAEFGLEYRYNSTISSCYVTCDPKGTVEITNKKIIHNHR